MTAAVETMFSARKVPWHGIGTVTPDVLTAEEAIKAAELDWDVELKPVVFIGQDGKTHQIEDRFAVVRDRDEKALGVVGSDYVPLQNRDAFKVTNDLIADGSFRFDSAGSLHGGKVIWVAGLLPEAVTVAGTDKVNIYIVLSHGHFGGKAIQLMVTPVRVVCQNTLTMAGLAAKHTFSIAHRGKVHDRLNEARRALELTYDYTKQFEAIAEKLAAETITEKQVDAFLTKLLQPKVDAGADRARKTHYDGIKTMLTSSPNLEGFRDRKWGVYNAVTEWMDWGRQIRTDESRVLGAWEGQNKHVRNRALELLT